MSYVIAIGGTGTRFLESVIHLCAAGLGPAKLSLILIDPDTANGNIDRVEKIIETYKKCRDIFSRFIKEENFPLFKTEINYYGSTSPVLPGKNNLEEHFSFYGLRKDYQNLCNLFYTEDERKEEWDKGFKGRANLGAPVMADIESRLDNPPWDTFINDIQATLNNGICHLFIAGSIFGATGASGFPTIAKILREREWDKKSNLRIGGILILPYFYFDVPQKVEGLYADSRNFLVKSKSALSHYSFVWKNGSSYDRIYFIGDRYHHKLGNFSKGGMDQENPLNWVDVIASSSLFHFLSDTQNTGISTEYYEESKETKYYYARRKKKEVIGWEDIPLSNFKEMVSIFAVFAMSYQKFFKPLMDDENFDKRKVLIPWYLDSFKHLKDDKEAPQLKNILEYMKHFVRFINQVQNTSNNELKVKLFQDQALENLDFGNLLIDKPKVNYKNDRIFDILCKRNWEEKGEATGDLFHMLYQSSKIFCDKYYF